MPLSFSQPCSLGALLLLLVSNLLLWENVVSVPFSSDETDDDQLHLKDLFDHALILSQDISKLNTEMRRIFTISESSAKFFDKFLSSSSESSDQFMFEFLGGKELLVKTLTSCHNYSIKTPENVDEAQKISLEDFPKLILSRVQAWNDTLDNLLTIVGSMPGMHDDILSIAKDVRTKNAELFEDAKSILNKVFGTIENVDYTFWSGLEDFQSSDEDFRFFALCKLSYCLHVDINAVDLSLMLLGCVVLVDSDICSSSRIGEYS
ncbi:prolactin-7A1-like isoform X1 [Peromyscus californicus insignis]|uniref:prolactin-7A1-like isoform X1 n=1 Tax=Peromyscus californicus insignis TaxID=564181 RepID=UPI0022A77969|nr:prolactin-7A1-like isoform X1 [Peromyscus californicus insignis]